MSSTRPVKRQLSPRRFGHQIRRRVAPHHGEARQGPRRGDQRPDGGHAPAHGVDIGGPIHRAGEDQFAARLPYAGRSRTGIGGEVIEIDAGRDGFPAAHAVILDEEGEIALGDRDHLVEGRQPARLERRHLAALAAPYRAPDEIAGVARMAREDLGLDVVGEQHGMRRRRFEQNGRMNEIGHHHVEALA